VVVPATLLAITGFDTLDEWQQQGTKKQPYLIGVRTPLLCELVRQLRGDPHSLAPNGFLSPDG
jgi:hypothetical protein